MDKFWRIRCSNWEVEQFDRRQIEYVMNDVLVVSYIFLRLVKVKVEKRKVFRIVCIFEDFRSDEKNVSGYLGVGLIQDQIGIKLFFDNFLGNSIIDRCYLILFEEEFYIIYFRRIMDSIEFGVIEDEEKFIENRSYENKNKVNFFNKIVIFFVV